MTEKASQGVMDIRSLQKPLKEQYRRDPESSRITLTAKESGTANPLTCLVDIGRAIYQAEAHKGVGGSGSSARSAHLPTSATAMGIPIRHIDVSAHGDMDLQGTLGISKEVPVGFEAIRVEFHLDAPQATADELRILQEKTEQYCVVLQTLLHPPKITTVWSTAKP